MSDSVERLLGQLLHKGEREWIEFKENNDQPQLIGEYLSALSNGAALCDQSHGYLIYGISDDARVVGTKFDPKKAKGKGAEDLEPWLARNLEPRIDFRIIEHSYKGQKVVVLKVNSARVSPSRFIKQAYVRIGSHKKNIADYPEKEKALWRAISQLKFEPGIALAKQSSDDVLKKIDYSGFCDLLDIGLPDNRRAILDLLEDERLIVEDEEGLHITNMGALLFAKNLNDFPSLKRKAARVIIYKDESRINALKERESSRGYAVDFEELLNWINDQLPSSERIEGAVRQNEKSYPKVAIREFMANALIHQDFTVNGTGPMIEIFSSRIELTNPGSPLVETLRFIDHPPRSRNEDLAALMRRMNLCEERGSGVDRALINIELSQLPAPEFIAEKDYTRVTLFAYRLLKDMDRKDRVRACFQHSVLCWLNKEFMTNTSLRERLGVEKQNYSMVSRIIKECLEQGLIKVADPENRSNKKKYIPNWC